MCMSIPRVRVRVERIQKDGGLTYGCRFDPAAALPIGPAAATAPPPTAPPDPRPPPSAVLTSPRPMFTPGAVVMTCRLLLLASRSPRSGLRSSQSIWRFGGDDRACGAGGDGGGGVS